MSNKDNILRMKDEIMEADKKLQGYIGGLTNIVEKSSHTPEDRILLAGAMISIAKALYIQTAGVDQGQWFFDQNISDLVPLLKPTIH